ncbi:hypothetical protein BJ322DRAFT_1211500 [Thelephora terrestris]|uniref:Nephrocystin 3-like N-terminal domain-containing protein n=1 Tax=Thelephora terrestris TaxID=56493 RepID=A0A9P6HF34_9AGAM|nr:hypothetical protein BJ322DRAFT_1211500 [Thelephora terrestris]
MPKYHEPFSTTSYGGGDGGYIGSSSPKNRRLIDATKMLVLRITKEPADCFPPLKSCLGGIISLMEHYEESEDVEDKLGDLAQWFLVRRYVIVATVSNGGNREEAQSREEFIRSLEDIERQSRALLGKGKTARILNKMQDSGTVVKLIEQLQQAITVYQQQSIDDRASKLAVSFDEYLKPHEVWIESILARMGGLNLGGSTGDGNDYERTTALLKALEGIENKLHSISERSNAVGYRENDADVQAVCELAEHLIDATFEYQLARQKEIYELNCKMIDSGREIFCFLSADADGLADELALLDNCNRAYEAGWQCHQRIPCLQGTRGGVLDEIEIWAGDFDTSPVFWLNGLAGTGKSAIAQTIAERTFADGRLGASFFCSRGIEERSNLHLIFPTLAFELAQKYPDFRSSLVPVLQSNPDIVHDSLLFQMETLIVGPLLSAGVSTVIVIDALDQCKDEEPESAILLVLGQLVNSIPNVKFFITSRPERHIVSGFRGPLLKEATNVFILHQVDRSTVDNDIRRFFKLRLSELASSESEVWPTDEQVEPLCRRAAGFFAYAAATVTFLRVTSRELSDRLKVIMESPEITFQEGQTDFSEYIGLGRMYALILQAAFFKNDTDDDALVRSVLSVVFLATKPLRLSAIATLLGLERDVVLSVLEPVQSLLILHEDVNQPIQPFHKSFADFMMDPSRCYDGRFHISPDNHINIFICCLKLMEESLKKNMCSIPDFFLNHEIEDLVERIEASGISGALEYACRSWHSHLILTEDHTSIALSTLHDFLEKRFIFWLEALSVLGIVDIAVGALGAALRWLNKIRVSADLTAIFDTIKDCRRFVNEFFEVISKSAPHIYHSALPSASQFSIVRRLYGQYISSPVPKVVIDNPTLRGLPARANHAVYSPDNQLIAVGWVDSVTIYNPRTLENLLMLRTTYRATTGSLTFSPDGHLLAYAYRRAEHGLERSSPISSITVDFWDTKTGTPTRILEIDGHDSFNAMFTPGVIAVVGIGGGIHTCDMGTGGLLWKGKITPSHNNQLGAQWVHNKSFRFATSSRSDGQLMVSICELQEAPNFSLPVVETFLVLPHHGEFSFCPISYHASFSTETEVTILDVRSSYILFRTEETSPLYRPPGRFSHDGSIFVCGTVENEIYVWKNTPNGYVPRGSLRPLLSFIGFAVSPVATSILSWGPEGLELFGFEDFAGHRAHVDPIQQEDCIIIRRAVAGPVKWLKPDVPLRIEGAGTGDQQICLPGTRGTILESIKSWSEDSNRPPIFLLQGLAGTGKSAIARTFMEWCGSHGHLGSFFFCSSDVDDPGNAPLIVPSLAIQLAQQHPKVCSILVPILRSNPDVVYESTQNQVQQLIVKPLMSADVPAVIVIDALDEWMDEVSQSAILSAVEESIREVPKVKFLITGRPKPHVIARSSLLFFTGLAEFVDLDDTALDLTDTDIDIHLFLEHALAEPAAQKQLDSWPTPVQLDLLRDRAAGLFVYAVATVKFLGQNHTSPAKQFAIIEEFPDDTVHEGTVGAVHKGLSLDCLCTSTLQASFRNVEDDATTRLVLATVVLATRPLPPSVIAELICLEVEEVMTLLGSIQSLLRLQEDPDQPVLPFHKLLSDLLTSPTRCADERFYISPGKFHSEIALNCLMSINEISEDNLSPETTEAEHLLGKPALSYACTSWYIHLAESRENVKTLIPALRRFLEEGFKAWLKVLRAQGERADPVFAMNETVSWLRGMTDDGQLLNDADQCLHFIKQSV